MNYLNWGAKATDKIVPPNMHPVVAGLKCSGSSTYTNHFPVNEQTLDERVINMIKNQ